MPPSVGRSIAEGFRLATRSWGAMGLFVLAWVAVGIIGVGGLALTQPPADAIETATAPASEFPAPPAPPEEAGIPAAPAEDEAAAEIARLNDAQREELNDWLGRAWPILLFDLLLIIAAGLLIQGGQLGYVVQRVRAGQAGWADISRAAAQSFVGLLGAGALSLGAVVLVILLAGLLLPALGALPGAVGGVLSIALMVSLVGAGVWLSLRLALWPVAIVAERLGPVAGLKASWRLSRGRWWTLAGIALVFLAVSLGVALVSGGLEAVGNTAGGGLAAAMQIVSALIGLLANIMLSFATMGSLVRFHEDAKGVAA